MDAGWAQERALRPSALETVEDLDMLTKLRSKGDIVDLPTFISLKGSPRMRARFSRYFDRITSIHIDAATDAYQGSVAIVEDVKREFPILRWRELYIRTRNLHELDEALLLCRRQIGQPDIALHLRTLSLQCRRAWSSDESLTSIKRIQDLAPQLRKLSLFDVPLLWEGLYVWDIEELELSAVRQKDMFPLPTLKTWHDILMASPSLRKLSLQHSTQRSQDIETMHLRDFNMTHDAPWGSRRSSHTQAVDHPRLRMLRCVKVEQDVILGIMNLVERADLECLILAHTSVQSNSLLNPGCDPLWILGPFVWRRWPSLRMLSLRGITLTSETMLQLFAHLPDLEALDICEYNRHHSLRSEKEALLPKLAILRALPRTIDDIQRLTGRSFQATELTRLRELDLPQHALLIAYSDHLTWGGESKWYWSGSQGA
ncbi:hypothetical protein CALCODRAFT_354836 [Calocera cornea HHB12733]|uniref:F-box domain-containing protein n=1 Tax=Calocera cornea HHB12733 TaxID=1353952 RepID=A0A165ER79_9BASI|nr:hypothetical protein CALCODRAFT_354836 [Calocera cornea HHB12733]